MFRELSPGFFDRIVIDECHRGSAKADSNNAAWQRDLALNRRRVAGILVQQGEVARALDEFLQGRAIIARLKEATNAQLAKDFAVFNAEIAKLEQGRLRAVQSDQIGQ